MKSFESFFYDSNYGKNYDNLSSEERQARLTAAKAFWDASLRADDTISDGEMDYLEKKSAGEYNNMLHEAAA